MGKRRSETSYRGCSDAQAGVSLHCVLTVTPPSELFSVADLCEELELRIHFTVHSPAVGPIVHFQPRDTNFSPGLLKKLNSLTSANPLPAPPPHPKSSPRKGWAGCGLGPLTSELTASTCPAQHASLQLFLLYG